MDKTMLFDLEHIVAVDGNGGMIATFVLVDEDDEDEYPPIVAVRCPKCHSMVEDFVEHRCSK